MSNLISFDKDQAWKQAKRTKNAHDIIRAKRLRNEIKDMIRRAQKDFIQEELGNDNVTGKTFWEKKTTLLASGEKGNTIRLIDKGRWR